MLPEHTKFIHTCQITASDALIYDFDGRQAELEIKRKIFDSLVQEMAKHVTFSEMMEPKYFDKVIRGSVVMMTVDEYKKILDQRYIVKNPTTVTKVVYEPLEDIDPVEVVKKADEVIDKAVKTSRTATDYLTNRVSQIQNEHLLPKRRP
jgi:hypothetical protein